MMGFDPLIRVSDEPWIIAQLDPAFNRKRKKKLELITKFPAAVDFSRWQIRRRRAAAILSTQQRPFYSAHYADRH